MTRTTCALVVAALLAMAVAPAYAQNGSENDSSRHPADYDESYNESRRDSECRDWMREASRRTGSFHDRLREDWQTFVASDPNASEIEAKHAELRERIRAFHEEMRHGFETHCGDAGMYEEREFDYDDAQPGDRPAGYPAECAPHHRRFVEQARRLARNQSEDWQAFQERWRTRWDNATDDGNVTPAEARAIGENRSEAAHELLAEHRREWEQLAESFENRPDCVPPGHDADDEDPAPDCTVGDWAGKAEQYAASRRDDLQRFRHLQQRKFLHHVAEVNATVRDHVENGSLAEMNASERHAFLAKLRADHAEYAREVANETEAFAADQRDDFETFVDGLRRTCVRAFESARPDPVPPAGGPGADLRRCVLEVRQRFADEIADASGEPSKQLRERMKAAMADCHEDRDGAEHPAEAKDRSIGSWEVDFDPANRSARMDGDHVALTAHMPSNTMRDYAVKGRVYFGVIQATSRFAEGGPKAGGSETPSKLVAGGDGIEAVLHDNPVGLITFRADGEAFLLTVADGVQVQRTRDGLALQAGSTTGRLTGNVSWDAASRVATVEGHARFKVPEAPHPATPAKAHDALAAARRSGALGGEITVAASDGQAVHEALMYAAVDVQVDARPGDHRVAVTLSAEDVDCKAFTVNLARDVVGADRRLDVDHEVVDEATGDAEPADLVQADGIADVLDCRAGEPAKYVVVEGAEKTALLVSVPDWSTHRFTVQGVPAETGHPLPAPGAVVAVLTLLAAAVALTKPT